MLKFLTLKKAKLFWGMVKGGWVASLRGRESAKSKRRKK